MNKSDIDWFPCLNLGHDKVNISTYIISLQGANETYQNSCQLNPYITKDKIMRKIILINIHNLWRHNVYKTYFLP